ncbi:ER membrane protein complex subunit 3 [Belonocnema kinseyi]|uniref:ER membrane protein complex subunit 3 n=1 Tax=Belonocnema kinseyi TaxID=2817044 RepID=UPI00143CF119|nr:ER membrane protein complex subunit 3 [Belonocnema kinseyi]
MAELLLDPNIRSWVFLPIVVITFLVGIVRHFVSMLLFSQKKIEVQQVQDSQVMMRSRLLRENGHYISKYGFKTRKQFFNNEEMGYFKTQKRAPVTQNPMADPSMMTDMLKGNITNVLPMVVIGGWINWMFSGFVTTKVPFPLTLRFKPMLQRGIELTTLDAAWVSSVSWYFLNVFGLRSIYTLVLGENNAADSTRQLQDQVSMSAMSMPPDPKAAFKAEWEALEICDHNWALSGVDASLIGLKSSSEESSYYQSKAT